MDYHIVTMLQSVVVSSNLWYMRGVCLKLVTDNVAMDGWLKIISLIWLLLRNANLQITATVRPMSKQEL